MITLEQCNVFAPDGRLLLRDVQLSVRRGERLVLVGPNGCGKSTLLRYIAGFGERCDGVLNVSRDANIAFLPSRPLDFLLPWLTVANTFEMFIRLAQRTVSGTVPVLNHLRSLADLSSHLSHKVYQLSSGQQAFLALCCAFTKKPNVLLVDEIFTTLSGPLRLQVADLFSTEGITMLCASHDEPFVSALRANRCNLERNQALANE